MTGPSASMSGLSPARRDNWTFDDCFPDDGIRVSRLTHVVLEEIAASCDREIASLWPSMKLVEDLGFDVLDRVELVLRLETEFGIEISDANAEAWLTIGNVVSSVRILVMAQTAKS